MRRANFARRSFVATLALLGSAGCNKTARLPEATHPVHSKPTPVQAQSSAAQNSAVPAPGGVRQPFVLYAKSPNNELWAYRRGRTGSVKVLRTRDWKVVAMLPITDDLVGDSYQAYAGEPPFHYGTRFCGNDRLGLLTRSETKRAAYIWDSASGSFREIKSERPWSSEMPAKGSGQAMPVGWSEACELVAFSTLGVRFRPGANESEDTPIETQLLIRLIDSTNNGSLGTSFEVTAAQSRNVSVADIADGAILLSARHYGVLDRKSGETTFLARDIATWVRADSRSFVMVPTFAEAPRLFRLGVKPDAATKAAFAARSDPKRWEKPGDVVPSTVAAALHPAKDIVAVFDGERMAWWSLGSGRRLRLQPIEPFDRPDFELHFSRDGSVTIAHDRYGNVVGVRHDGGIIYRHALGMTTCGGRSPCATGNRSELMTAVVSEDGAALAIGTERPPSFDVGKPAEELRTTIVDLATGTLSRLPTWGTPLTFVNGHDKLIIGEEVWSLTEKRIVAHLPD